MTPESDAVPDRDPYLLAQMREAFGRVVFSHKTYETQADICFTKHRWQQGVPIALTAISSGTFLAAVVGLLGNAVLTSLVTSSIALLVSWMSLGTKTFKFEEESEAHRGIASRLWEVREFYISLIAGLMSGTLSNAEGRERRDELQQAARPGRVVERDADRPEGQVVGRLVHERQYRHALRFRFPPGHTRHFGLPGRRISSTRLAGRLPASRCAQRPTVFGPSPHLRSCAYGSRVRPASVGVILYHVRPVVLDRRLAD
ncbi:SLATT domain-containing protein [Streptomyces sp. NPDC047002]|uniref:SLATT domain-containing protein n=1 Tax=Streptomyces sp. NPDC047002 TaxID=3155475 RepID=UPI0034572536